MRIKSVVQTGPKTHDGGLNAGLMMVGYQSPTDAAVKIDPMKPAERERRMVRMSLAGLGSGIHFFKSDY